MDASTSDKFRNYKSGGSFDRGAGIRAEESKELIGARSGIIRSLRSKKPILWPANYFTR